MRTSAAPSTMCCASAASSRRSSSSAASWAVPARPALWSARGLKTTALRGDKSQDERLGPWKPLRASCGRSAGVYRRGCPWAGHQGRASGVQLRSAVRRRRLCPPHWPHGPRRGFGAGRFAGVAKSDSRLLGDIEKLINIKANVEPLPLEDAGTPRSNVTTMALHRWGRTATTSPTASPVRHVLARTTRRMPTVGPRCRAAGQRRPAAAMHRASRLIRF